MSETVTFTREKYLELKKHYKQAVTSNKDTFEFDGAPVFTAYAKYLLEYLSGIPGIGKP